MDRSWLQDLAVDLLRASGAFYRDDASYPIQHAPLPPSASSSAAAAELAAAAQEQMKSELRGPLSRQHFAVATHPVWGGVGVWECAFYQLFSRETSARAADLYGKRMRNMDETEREQQQQVEQNIAVRCMRDVGTMMATMCVDETVGSDLLGKLEMMGMISTEGNGVSAGLISEQYAAAAKIREEEVGRERAWLERRLERAMEAEQQAMDRVNSFKAQCAAMDQQCEEMERREKETRAEIEKQVRLAIRLLSTAAYLMLDACWLRLDA